MLHSPCSRGETLNLCHLPSLPSYHMSWPVESFTYIVTPRPIPAFSLSTTIPSTILRLPSTKTTQNDSSTTVRPSLDNGDVDVSSTPLSLLWLDASPSTAAYFQTSRPSFYHHTTFTPWPPISPDTTDPSFNSVRNSRGNSCTHAHRPIRRDEHFRSFDSVSKSSAERLAIHGVWSG